MKWRTRPAVALGWTQSRASSGSCATKMANAACVCPLSTHAHEHIFRTHMKRNLVELRPRLVGKPGNSSRAAAGRFLPVRCTCCATMAPYSILLTCIIHKTSPQQQKHTAQTGHGCQDFQRGPVPGSAPNTCVFSRAQTFLGVCAS